MVYSAAVLFGSPCVGPLVEHHFAHLQALMVHLPSPMEVDNEAVVDLELAHDPIHISPGPRIIKKPICVG
uniref:Cytochrome P450 n=1 Tax=Knipowitschia caucasica TaxID=637954 RepID=A0AAV2JYI5_KNICA